MFTVRAKEQLEELDPYAGGYDGPWRMFLRGAGGAARALPPLRSSGQRNIGGGGGASLRKKEEVTANAERESSTRRK